MRIRGQVLFGIVIVVIGLAFLIGSVFDFDVGTLCFPMALILIGAWILVRPRLEGGDTPLRLRIFGPVRRGGDWQVGDEEILLFIGDVRLHLSEAEVPPGETKIRVYSFISNVRVTVPEGVGVSQTSMAFINDVRTMGQRRSGFLVPVTRSSEGYAEAERKVHVESMAFISDMRARRG
jgi:predicted membrane protein